jgi:hypothetical protein
VRWEAPTDTERACPFRGAVIYFRFLSRHPVVYSTVVLRAVRSLTSVGAPAWRPVSLRVPWEHCLLAALLIVALLLCHGVLGFTHQVHTSGPCGPAASPQSSGMYHGVAADPVWDLGGEAGGHGVHGVAGGLGPLVYFAAVSVLFGTALLGLLSGESRRRTAPTLRSLLRWPPPPEVVYRPLGPSPPLLQAFRL